MLHEWIRDSSPFTAAEKAINGELAVAAAEEAKWRLLRKTLLFGQQLPVDPRTAVRLLARFVDGIDPPKQPAPLLASSALDHQLYSFSPKLFAAFFHLLQLPLISN